MESRKCGIVDGGCGDGMPAVLEGEQLKAILGGAKSRWKERPPYLLSIKRLQLQVPDRTFAPHPTGHPGDGSECRCVEGQIRDQHRNINFTHGIALCLVRRCWVFVQPTQWWPNCLVRTFPLPQPLARWIQGEQCREPWCATCPGVGALAKGVWRKNLVAMGWRLHEFEFQDTEVLMGYGFGAFWVYCRWATRGRRAKVLNIWAPMAESLELSGGDVRDCARGSSCAMQRGDYLG